MGQSSFALYQILIENMVIRQRCTQAASVAQNVVAGAIWRSDPAAPQRPVQVEHDRPVHMRRDGVSSITVPELARGSTRELAPDIPRA
jgi:hypothetical protein